MITLVLFWSVATGILPQVDHSKICGDVNGRLLLHLEMWEPEPPGVDLSYRVVYGSALLFSVTNEVVLVEGQFHVSKATAELSFCYNCGYQVWYGTRVPGDTKECSIELTLETLRHRMHSDGKLKPDYRVLRCQISHGAIVPCEKLLFLDSRIVNPGDLFHFFRLLGHRQSAASPSSR